MQEWTIYSATLAQAIFNSYWEVTKTPIKMMASRLNFPKSVQTLHRLVSWGGYWKPDLLKAVIPAQSSLIGYTPEEMWYFINAFEGGNAQSKCTVSLDWLLALVGEFKGINEDGFDALVDARSHRYVDTESVREFGSEIPFDALLQPMIEPVVASWSQRLSRLPYQRSAAQAAEIWSAAVKKNRLERRIAGRDLPTRHIWVSDSVLERIYNQKWPYDRCGGSDAVDELFEQWIYDDIPNRTLMLHIYKSLPGVRHLQHGRMDFNKPCLPDEMLHHVKVVNDRWYFVQMKCDAVANYFDAEAGNGLSEKIEEGFDTVNARVMHDDKPEAAQEFLRRYLRHDSKQAFIQEAEQSRRQLSLRSVSKFRVHPTKA